MNTRYTALVYGGNTSDKSAQIAINPLPDKGLGSLIKAAIKGKHDHPELCHHLDLKYCMDCDTVECQKCLKEWKAQNFTTSIYPRPNWIGGVRTQNL